MKKIIIFFILIFLICFSFSQKNLNLYNKLNRPSSQGISLYIKNNYEKLITDFENLIQDTIYNVYIYTDNLSKVSDGLSIGEFYPPDQIIITNEEKFIEYEWKNLSNYQKRTYSYGMKTVKSVIFHELSHVYFYQNIINLKNEGKNVSSEYGLIRIFANYELKFGSTFIEEGFCEYIVHCANECYPLTDIEIPKTINEITNINNEEYILYHYSVYFLKDFLQTYGLKQGIRILLQNKPPSYEEILHPELYFKRIKNNFKTLLNF